MNRLILDRFQIAAAPSTIALAVSRTEYLFPGVGEHTYGVALPAHVELWVLPGHVVHRVTWLERLGANLTRVRAEIEAAARDQVAIIVQHSQHACTYLPSLMLTRTLAYLQTLRPTHHLPIWIASS